MTTGIGMRTAATWLALPLSGSGNHTSTVKKQNTPLGKPSGVFWENKFAQISVGAFHQKRTLAHAFAEVV